MSKHLPELCDTTYVTLQLVEDGSAGKKVKVRGEFAKADIATSNGRIYPRTLWEREIKRLRPAMKERRVFGELDHPADGRTLLTRASHLLLDLHVQDDGIIVGEAEALDTSKGKDLQALFRAGAKVGISSRGFGSTKPNTEGAEIVQEDYRLGTFDFVDDPADASAFPESFYESKERTMDAESLKADVDARVAEEVAKAVSEREATVRAEVDAEVAAKIEQAKESVRAELLSDPKQAGAQVALERLREVLCPLLLPEEAQGVVQAKNAEIARLEAVNRSVAMEIAELRAELAKTSGLLREMGNSYYLEKQIGSRSNAELVRNLVGAMKQYESVDELQERLVAIELQLAEAQAKADAEERVKREAEQAELEQARQELAAKERQVQERLEQELAKQQALAEEIEQKMEDERQQVNEVSEVRQNEVHKLRLERDELMEAVEKALEANRQQALMLYAERKLANHPRAIKLRKVLEAAHVEDESDIDSIIREHSNTGGSTGLDSVRERIRSLSAGKTYSALDEETGKNRSKGRNLDEDNFQGLGVSLSALRRASGLGS